MISKAFLYPIQFILLVLFQALILNNIQFSGFINPYLYILFILWLPIETPKFLLLALSFLMGLSIDTFSDTLGMHTSASLFLAFCRPYILQFISPREGYEPNQNPTIKELGRSWFLLYAILMTIPHHLFLFFVEVFRFSEFWSTIGRSLASSVFTILLILIVQLFNYNVGARK